MKKVLSVLSALAISALLSVNTQAQNNGPLVYTSYDVFPVFQADYYLRVYPEVRNLCGGKNYSCAKSYFFGSGPSRGFTNGSPVFDVEAYMNLNLNMAENYNYYSQLMINHYKNYGVYEGRRATRGIVFDPEEYMELNPDVVNAQGNSDYYKAVSHWFHHGVNEGRPSSHDFKVKRYINNYSDLRRKFGDDYAAGLVHWWVHGWTEGRTKTN